MERALFTLDLVVAAVILAAILGALVALAFRKGSSAH